MYIAYKDKIKRRGRSIIAEPRYRINEFENYVQQRNRDAVNGSERTIRIEKPFALYIITVLIISEIVQNVIILLNPNIPIYYVMFTANLAVLGILAIVGIMRIRKWGFYLILLFAGIQLTSKLTMLIFYFQLDKIIELGVSIAIAVCYILFFLQKRVRHLYLE